MKYEGLISIFFFGGPFLLMVILSILKTKNIEIDWKLLIGIDIVLLAIACILQINKPLLNGPTAHIIVFVIFPYNVCFLSTKLRLLWKCKIIGILSIPVIYYNLDCHA